MECDSECVCVCVSERKRVGGWGCESEREREGETEGECECESVCEREGETEGGCKCEGVREREGETEGECAGERVREGEGNRERGKRSRVREREREREGGTLCSKGRRLLALPARALLKLVQEGRKGHLLDGGVDMQHAGEAGRQDALELDDVDLGLERTDAVDGVLDRGEYGAGDDVFLLDAAHPQPHLVATRRVGELFVRLGGDGDDFDRRAAGHQEQRGTLFNYSGLDLALNHHSHVPVLARDWHREGRPELTLEPGHAVEVFEQRGAVVPVGYALGDAVFEALASEGRERHEFEVWAGRISRLSFIGRST